MEAMKRLYFGPWCGEFGWEVMWAIPVLRKIAADFDHVTICGPVGHEYLWDFASEYIGVRTQGECYQRGVVLDEVPPPPAGATVITPDQLWQRFGKRERAWLAGKGDSPAPKTWKEYGEAIPPTCDSFNVLLALRGPKYGAEWKEWPRDYADTLSQTLAVSGLAVGSVGGHDNYRPPFTPDLRCIELAAVCDYMRGSIVVGPSSGPLHLAALCGARKIVTWFAGPDCMRSRYETQWNPFNVPVEYICSGRQPTPDEVLARIV